MHYQKLQNPDKTKLVVSVILVNNDKVLMHLRDKKRGIAFPNYWSLPSGRVAANESPTDAAKREFMEETGYILSSVEQFFPKFLFTNKPRVKSTYFFVSQYDNIQKICCNEGQKMEFKKLDEIKKLHNLVPGIYQIVKEVLND